MDNITQALKALGARQTSYRTYADYYDGRHKLAFATDKFRNAFGNLFRAFADNLCSGVVDAVADRLQLIGFSSEEGAEAPAAVAWDIWKANRMDRRAGEVHREGLRCGDAYVVVWPNVEGVPTLYPNPAAAMAAGYDPEEPGRIAWAAKAWTLDDGRLRLNLYYADRIEKYVTRAKADGFPSRANAFVPFEAPGEPWPLPNPWQQVPVFHFANGGDVGQGGRSELADVVPLQDALNKAVADTLVAMEYVALPQRWATGLEVDTDPATGKPRVPFTPGVERIWAVGDPEVRFGQFDPANLEQFLSVQEKFRQEIAVVSRTPLHFITPPTGDFPSGEALKTAESTFLAKVANRQIAFGDVWENALGLALRMAGQPARQLSALWKDATPRSNKEMVEVAVLKSQVGVSQEQNLRELGYSPEQIEQMQEEREASSADLAENMLTAFERDDGGGGEEGDNTDNGDNGGTRRRPPFGARGRGRGR